MLVLLMPFSRFKGLEFDRFEVIGQQRYIVLYCPDKDADYWFETTPLSTKDSALNLLRRKDTKSSFVFHYEDFWINHPELS